MKTGSTQLKFTPMTNVLFSSNIECEVYNVLIKGTQEQGGVTFWTQEKWNSKKKVKRGNKMEREDRGEEERGKW